MGCAPSTLLPGGKRVPGVVFLDKGAQWSGRGHARGTAADRRWPPLAPTLAAPPTPPPLAAGSGEGADAAPQAGKVFKLEVDATASRRNGDTLILAVRGGAALPAAAGCRQLPPAVDAPRARAVLLCGAAGPLELPPLNLLARPNPCLTACPSCLPSCSRRAPAASP